MQQRSVYYDEKMQNSLSVDSFRSGCGTCSVFANRLDNKNSCALRYNTRNTLLQELTYGGITMKIVLIKSPKVLAPILRAMFKVKKIHYED